MAKYRTRSRKRNGSDKIDTTMVMGVRGRRRVVGPSDQAGDEKRGHAHIFILIWMVRWTSAMITCTEFVPDEGWQSTEVAYYYTFGRGHLTWEWIVGLRNHIYPFIFAVMYNVFKFFGLDTPNILVLGPRMFQATATAIGDCFFFLYCLKRFGYRSARCSVGLMLLCWFSFYCGPRTITNTTEMTLNCIAMYLMENDHAIWLVGVVAFNFLIRPTAIVVWIPQILHVLALFFPLKVPHRLPIAVFVGFLILGVGAILDSVVYGRPVVTAMRFIRFNFFEGQSAQFGEHHLLWYFYSGLPSILNGFIIPFVYALRFPEYKKERNIVLVFLVSFSLIRHKEIRFLLPILPFIFSITGDVLSKFFAVGQSKGADRQSQAKIHLQRSLLRGLSFCAFINVLASLYFTKFHQGGILPATQFINRNSLEIKKPNIWVMMPCYAVPVFTYMHNPHATFQYMTCGPPDLELEKVFPNFKRYTTNGTELEKFVAEKTSTSDAFPHFVMCFDEISSKLIAAFRLFGQQFYECFRRLHAQLGEDRGMISVLCRQGIPLAHSEKSEPSHHDDHDHLRRR